jgi:terminase small subunit / prophage DNA-packing protein
MLINKRELAETIGVSQQALDGWQKQGMPIEVRASRGLENQYETANVIRWMIDREVQKLRTMSPKDRLDNLRADEVEIRLAERCGQLIDAGEAENLWRTVITTARIEFDSFADQLESKMRAKNIDVSEFNIRSSMVELLSRLETLEIPDADQLDTEEEPTEITE